MYSKRKVQNNPMTENTSFPNPQDLYTRLACLTVARNYKWESPRKNKDHVNRSFVYSQVGRCNEEIICMKIKNTHLANGVQCNVVSSRRRTSRVFVWSRDSLELLHFLTLLKWQMSLLTIASSLLEQPTTPTPQATISIM